MAIIAAIAFTAVVAAITREQPSSMPTAHRSRSHNRGFTLIEISIVLVIIGLVVGGVLVGQDLIRSAAVRAQITQIEKYQTAVNTFRGKFNALPGDMNAATASQFGFTPRGAYAGQGDGNGVIEGYDCTSPNCVGYNNGVCVNAGDTVIFWRDLAQAGLIEGLFDLGMIDSFPPNTISGTPLNQWFPAAPLGRGNFVYIGSGGAQGIFGARNGINYFNVSIVDLVSTAGGSSMRNGLTVAEAYSIDTKLDDGQPQSGRVTARIDQAWVGAYAGGAFLMLPVTAGSGVLTSASATTCYDNAGQDTAESYSISTSSGSGVNCSLAFQFQ